MLQEWTQARNGSLPRYDIPAKVDGSVKWAAGVKLPGMVHARNVKPPFAGATLVNGLPTVIAPVAARTVGSHVLKRREHIALAGHR